MLVSQRYYCQPVLKNGFLSWKNKNSSVDFRMKEKDFQKYWHSSIRGKFSNDLLGEVIFEFLHWHISNQSKYDQTNFHILCVKRSGILSPSQWQRYLLNLHNYYWEACERNSKNACTCKWICVHMCMKKKRGELVVVLSTGRSGKNSRFFVWV